MKKEFSTIKVIIIGSFSLVLLSACQSNLPPERPANTGDRTRVTPVINNDDALPTLTFNQSDKEGKFLLKNQIARYLNPEKTELEITFSNLSREFCAVESQLKAGEQELKIIVKSKVPIAKGELANNNNEITAIYRDGSSEQKFTGKAIETLKITDLNGAILRGKLKFSEAGNLLEGEYFTAICK